MRCSGAEARTAGIVENDQGKNQITFGISEIFYEIDDFSQTQALSSLPFWRIDATQTQLGLRSHRALSTTCPDNFSTCGLGRVISFNNVCLTFDKRPCA